MFSSRPICASILLTLGVLSLSRADDELVREFRSARGGIISQMRGKPAQRAAGVRKLSAYPIPDAAELLLDRGMASADASVRQASYETLLGFKNEAEVVGYLGGEVAKDLKKSKLKGGTCAALAALLASTTPEAGEAVEKLLDQAKEAPAGRLLVVSICDLIASPTSDDALADVGLAGLLKLRKLAPFQNEFGPRRAYMHALIAVRKPLAVTELVDCLASTQGETRAEILTHLSQISGESFDTDQQWQAWWKKNEATFEFPLKDEPLTVTRATAPAVASYYGLPLYGSRIVFVLDTSSSMRGPRIEAAKRELVRAIGELPDGVRFNVVAFSSQAGAWQRDLVPTSRESKRAATDYVLSQNLGSRTASYDALEAALAFDAESIYFLTDGAPTGGKIVRPAEIVQSIGGVNRVRRVTINCLGIGVGPAGNVFDTFLKTLSQQNFGAYRRVDE